MKNKIIENNSVKKCPFCGTQPMYYSDDFTDGEKKLLDWQFQRGGGFFTALFHAMSLADPINLKRFQSGFPSEYEAFYKFANEDGYYEKLCKKAGK